MTTREIYFKNVISGLPYGLVGYTFKDEKEIIQIGKNIVLEFKTDENTVNDSTERMETIEQTEGFMFWNNFPEGEKFFKDNCNVIGKCLANIILNQK
jgi:hypothetical protein